MKFLANKMQLPCLAISDILWNQRNVKNCFSTFEYLDLDLDLLVMDLWTPLYKSGSCQIDTASFLIGKNVFAHFICEAIQSMWNDISLSLDNHHTWAHHNSQWKKYLLSSCIDGIVEPFVRFFSLWNVQLIKGYFHWLVLLCIHTQVKLLVDVFERAENT